MNDETNTDIQPDEELQLDVEFPSGVIMFTDDQLDRDAFAAWFNNLDRPSTAGTWYHMDAHAEAFMAGRHSRQGLIEALAQRVLKLEDVIDKLRSAGNAAPQQG